MSILSGNGPKIVVYQPHNHPLGHDIEIGEFYDAMRQYALIEGTPAQTIPEEKPSR